MPIEDTNFDALVERLQQMPPFNVDQILPDGSVAPWKSFSGKALLPEIVINPHTLRQQCDLVAMQVGWWKRLIAQAKRVWEVRDREYRMWRAPIELQCMLDAKKDGTKATVAFIEATYRSHPEYGAKVALVEAAEEAHMAVEGIYEAFKEKARKLGVDVYLGSDGALRRYSP